MAPKTCSRTKGPRVQTEETMQMRETRLRSVRQQGGQWTTIGALTLSSHRVCSVIARVLMRIWRNVGIPA
jgi:hypothetical protein